MPKVEVPITPAVLDWAIEQSGYDEQQIADKLGVPVDAVRQWRQKPAKLGLTEARHLASYLHRTIAFFLLPNPPNIAVADVSFRHLPGASSRESLSPDERRYVRKAQRLQRVVSWLAGELEQPLPKLPRATLSASAATTAAAVRQLLKVPVPLQIEWASSSIAFDQWRQRLESLGLLVFLFPMGDESCRGFSIWDDRAPLIAANTAWNEEARIYTLFHELGHLVTRTNSACAEGRGDASAKNTKWDPAERWCEEFAAAVLLPADALAAVLKGLGLSRVFDVASVRRVARRFKTSLRATTIRLIELGFATWDLYDELPGKADAKTGGGGGGGGRVRREIREDQLGRRTTTLFHEAVDRDVMSRSQALSYLDVADSDFEQLAAR